MSLPLLTPIALPVSWLYGRVIAHRNRRFDRGSGVQRLDRPVVSVGNLSVGGAGKSPMVAWLACRLVERGVRVCIAMRGYGARPGEPSDEQAEYAMRVPDVPVVATPGRYEATRAFLQTHDEIDAVLLDDGFQHRMLHRDLDIVLIDARAATLRDRMLPAGRLREPPASLARADAVVITHADDVDPALADAVRSYAGARPVAWTRHRWNGLEVYDAEMTHVDVAWLDGRRVLTMLGIAQPGRVQRQLERAGATIVVDVPVRDHERYDRTRLAAVRPMVEGLDAMVCTGKDWAKLRTLIDVEQWPCPIVVPRLELEFLEGEQTLESLVLEHVRTAD